MEHSERIETSVADYLKGLAPATWSDFLMDTDTGTLRIFAGESGEDKSGQVIICHVDGDMEQEDPPFTNNRWCNFIIELRTPVNVDESPDFLDSHKANAAALENALLTDSFETSISNSGLLVYRAMDRVPIRDQTENYWMSGYRFRLYSCLSN